MEPVAENYRLHQTLRQQRTRHAERGQGRDRWSIYML
jgi:hypothetical protein